MPPPLYILFNQCTEEQRFRVRSADFCSIRPDSCTWSYTDPFLVRSVLLATYFLKYFLDRFFYLLGDHSFGVLSRFALYSLYLYCTACSGQFKFGPVHNMNWIGWCIFRPKQIRYTPLLTYAKSAILLIRSTSTWLYSCQMNLWSQRPAPQPILAAALGP